MFETADKVEGKYGICSLTVVTVHVDSFNQSLFTRSFVSPIDELILPALPLSLIFLAPSCSRRGLFLCRHRSRGFAGILEWHKL